MCKVFMVPHVKKDKIEKVQELTKAMATLMSVTESDGIGYAAITSTGKIFGEKWVNKDDAFKINENPVPDPVIIRTIETFGDAAKFKVAPKQQGVVYGSFGDLSLGDDTVGVILHARKKTIGDLCVANTHPFFHFGDPATEGDMDTALIHNGSIANHTQFRKLTSTCDSETLLNEYVSHMMNYNPWHITELSEKLFGEYAVGVLSSTYDNGEMHPILDIFKSHKDLYAGWVPELETYVFCTNEYNLESGIRQCGLSIQHIVEILDGAYLRFNCLTGERSWDIIEFTPSKRGSDFRANQSHHRPPPTPVKEYKEESSEDVRRNFQKNHPSVFNQQYHHPGKLTLEEERFFKELQNKSTTDHRALRLVAAATGK